MSEVLHANIFFFITAVSVVVLTIFVGVILFYFIQILRNVRDISNKVKRGSEILSKDFSEVRKTVKEEGLKSKHIFDFFVDRFMTRGAKKSTARRKRTTKKSQ